MSSTKEWKIDGLFILIGPTQLLLSSRPNNEIERESKLLNNNVSKIFHRNSISNGCSNTCWFTFTIRRACLCTVLVDAKTWRNISLFDRLPIRLWSVSACKETCIVTFFCYAYLKCCLFLSVLFVHPLFYLQASSICSYVTTSSDNDKWTVR